MSGVTYELNLDEIGKWSSSSTSFERFGLLRKKVGLRIYLLLLMYCVYSRSRPVLKYPKFRNMIG